MLKKQQIYVIQYLRKLKMARKYHHGRFLMFCVCLVALGLFIIVTPPVFERLLSSRSASDVASVWVFRSEEGFAIQPVKQVMPAEFSNEETSFDPSTSTYMLPPGSITADRSSSKKKPDESSEFINIAPYDPDNELSFLLRKGFGECEYNKCRMIEDLEKADAVIFLVAKLTFSPVPKFKRKPGQLWIMKTDEAPSRFSWFRNMNQTGVKDVFNWTFTHKQDSDIPYMYGHLVERERIEYKDYDKIYESKSKTAAWFVSHCPVRSDRMEYVKKMSTRTDIDVYGQCGTKHCGQAEKIPGVVAMRITADKEMCFPLLSSTYRFYLAFENSLCQEYVTEKFFKIFQDVDIVPVVRGGSDYKSYFPPNTFVDAADFSTPEALADYLDDLGRDKERYLTFLRNKNKYISIIDNPAWQCVLCEKLHTDKKKRTYTDVLKWWITNSCHDPKDSMF